MKDSDIIKALECCIEEIANCDNCPYEYYCNIHKNNMLEDALDLINRQKAEIERLEEILGGASKVVAESCAGVRVEAIREFATEVERRCIEGGIYPAFVKSQLENVKEEMVGE